MERVGRREWSSFFLSTMDLHTFRLYQDIVVTKKYWHMALFSSKEFLFIRLYILFSNSQIFVVTRKY